MQNNSRNIIVGSGSPQSRIRTQTPNSSASLTTVEASGAHLRHPANLHCRLNESLENCYKSNPTPVSEAESTDSNMILSDIHGQRESPGLNVLSPSRSETPLQMSDIESQPTIDKALSEFSKQYPGYVVDPEAYAHRTVQERQQKYNKEQRISRPLNSYMLYRKAYQQVARKVIRRDQQQFASQIVGTSWTKLEGNEVKSWFKNLAKVDHRMHHEAFPAYKYTPTPGKNSKNSPEARKTTPIERKRSRRPIRSIGEDTEPQATIRQISAPISAELLGQHQYSGVSVNWWLQEHSHLALPIPQHGITYDEVEFYSMPGSMYPVAQFQDELDHPASSHTSRQLLSLAPSPMETLEVENCIDPSLFSRQGATNPQTASRCLQWQSHNSTLDQEFPPFLADIITNQPLDVTYPEQDVWTVEQFDGRRSHFGWQAIGEDHNA
ncbi:hypothetical protein QQS21_002413 [Conoideocrella luteorostrata]|uniref:HMG box domain-containing protein n=1 Tax=Conoideocrella luteorostrata TaxID=1105319 RepID=A0AAJ0CY98_9HYPO|nr:hypothetical protein QQS21_002413 [Conoideocrella luteorostrata]